MKFLYTVSITGQKVIGNTELDFDHLYYKMSPQQLKELDETTKRPPDRIYDNYQLPHMKRNNFKDINVASVQTQVLDLSKELSLIGDCIENNHKGEGLNLLMPAMQSLSRIRTNARLDRFSGG
jgi:hypothetical protein